MASRYSKNNKSLEYAGDILGRLNTDTELLDALNDLFTRREGQYIEKRILTAMRLLDGESSVKIRNELRVGKQKVDNVRKVLRSRGDGYRIIYRLVTGKSPSR